MTDRVGQQLGNYQLLCLMGTGGFAEVYLGQHIYLNTQAAIKVRSTRGTSASSQPGKMSNRHEGRPKKG